MVCIQEWNTTKTNVYNEEKMNELTMYKFITTTVYKLRITIVINYISIYIWTGEEYDSIQVGDGDGHLHIYSQM